MGGFERGSFRTLPPKIRLVNQNIRRKNLLGDGSEVNVAFLLLTSAPHVGAGVLARATPTSNLVASRQAFPRKKG
jgi:hypothetical protein